MIDFACRQFDINEIIKCGLGLTKTEFEIFTYMIERRKEHTAHDLAKAKRLDLSTVQKALKKLSDMQIAERRQMNLSNGGYIYSYKIKDKSAVISKINHTIKGWAAKVEDELGKWA
ncbi:MAG: MarR family transcriptional regulator [Candidatus Woesearchaeota archaeon]|nr:MarR family transcriptional regulator [Candidatus Woesearchaeota archaeon]